ncbi:uncharacterized protein LOC142803422 [Rhipicephalus microplus]|uniref:uncharacterized protein LOC142803422 n=1 Tax=Rhipicephalus microplus TaxID=6941 RepID=UPI003F6AAFCB
MKGFFFVALLMLLQLLWNYSDAYVTGTEKGRYRYCLGPNRTRKSDESSKRTKLTVTRASSNRPSGYPVWSTNNTDKWGRLQGKYVFINCTDDGQCPLNCTCMKHSQNKSFCALIQDKDYDLDRYYNI